jgi:deazaflavin-dependent oxidoreductase (nitroreductase family)
MRLNVNGLVGRTIQKAAATAAFAPLASRFMPSVDRVFSRVTGGHFVPSQLLVPTLVLTTTGAKSGLARTTPLATLPGENGCWYVVGSNFGQARHPAWSGNLLKTLSAVVTIGGIDVPATATLLEGADAEAGYAKLVELTRTYSEYASRTDRSIRVFRLTAVPS